MRRWWVFFLWLPLFAAGTVPDHYIVELAGEPVAVRLARLGAGGKGRRASAAAREHRARVRDEQRAARLLLEREGATVVDSVDTVANALFVHIPDARAARLARVSGVLRVHPERQFHLLLDHALPLHKVPDAWNQVGIDKAGAGMKIGFIDTGIDIEHPGFQDPSLPIPDGFPKADTDSDLSFTNNKVIVARSYAQFLSKTDPDPSARDHSGHGTATAMAAAGVLNSGPLATISGVAPKAYLGSYKVFGSPGVNDSATDSAVLKAVDDAVADGMDVISLSLGVDLATRPEDDPLVQALERAAAVGVIVVAAAGNNGPDPGTIASPATAPSAIAVGASSNDRIFSASVSIASGGPYQSVPASGPAPPDPVTAPLVDVATLDGKGLACSGLPDNSLAGSIAFILRGDCFFVDKLSNAQRAGAVAALVYTDQDRPDPVTMDVGNATLPAQMVSYESGIDIKQRLTSPLQATLQFARAPFPINPDRLARFSAKGPTVDWAVKPDLVAVGTNVYTAAQKFDSQGDLFNPDGYVTENGTSFSAPLVSGAAALLKAARPGLTAAQYRSLLINSAATISLDPGNPAGVQQAGAGVLDVSAALRSTAAVAPVSLSFGIGGPDVQSTRNLIISNVGTASETFRLSVVPRDDRPAPMPAVDSVELAAGASVDLPLSFSASSLGPGQYEGFLVIQGTNSGVATRVPYWYAVGPDAPRRITVLEQQESGRRGAMLTDAIVFFITDASGLYIDNLQPDVTVASSDGEVLNVHPFLLRPGAFGVDLRLGRQPGPNVFHIQAGDASKDVTLITR